MEKGNRKKFGYKVWLCIALAMCVISSIGAAWFQTSGGSVRVEDFKIVVGDGTYINGQMYIPKKASADNKLPLIVVSHGSYNNMDMQDMNMIELSRRGFVVISSDAYGHGSSSTTPSGLEQSNMYQLIDYALASLEFIDKEKIGVSGHSMGGQIASETVAHYIEQEAKGEGENPVSAILTVGYDPQYTPYEFEGVEQTVDVTVDWGVIAAKYDEWFFSGETKNPALYLESEAAKSFVCQLDGMDIAEAVESGRYYSGTIDGKEYMRVIYQNPHEIHPLNHFSFLAAAEQAEFFYNAFGVPNGYEKLEDSDQIWIYKEGFNLLGLIGIFLFLIPFAMLIMDTIPFFNVLKRKDGLTAAPALKTAKRKIGYWSCYILCTVIPAVLVIPVAYKLVGKESFVPMTYNRWFGEPNTNELAAWTAVSALCLLGIFLLSHFIFGEKKEIPKYWGVKTTFQEVLRSFLLALLTVSAAYMILFASDLLFNTDYRIWVLAMRVFTVDKVIYAVAYVPAFVLFYLVNSLLVNGGNRAEGIPDWLVTVISCISNIVGLAVLIFIQYYGIIAHGTFAFNSMRIVNLFPLLTLIPIGTIIGRIAFKKTGKIYLGSFMIGILYTMMTVSNTMFLDSVLL